MNPKKKSKPNTYHHCEECGKEIRVTNNGWVVVRFPIHYCSTECADIADRRDYEERAERERLRLLEAERILQENNPNYRFGEWDWDDWAVYEEDD